MRSFFISIFWNQDLCNIYCLEKNKTQNSTCFLIWYDEANVIRRKRDASILLKSAYANNRLIYVYLNYREDESTWCLFVFFGQRRCSQRTESTWKANLLSRLVELRHYSAWTLIPLGEARRIATFGILRRPENWCTGSLELHVWRFGLHPWPPAGSLEQQPGGLEQAVELLNVNAICAQASQASPPPGSALLSRTATVVRIPRRPCSGRGDGRVTVGSGWWYTLK
jgi:hypothetical protein